MSLILRIGGSRAPLRKTILRVVDRGRDHAAQAVSRIRGLAFDASTHALAFDVHRRTPLALTRSASCWTASHMFRRGGERARAYATAARRPAAPTSPLALIAERGSRAVHTDRGAAAAVAAASSSSSSAAAAPAAPPPRNGMLARAVGVVREYGATAVVIYATLWVVPGVASYYTLVAAGNFGLDAGIALQYLPTAASEWLLSLLGVPPGGSFSPWHTSLLLAYLFTDVLELARLPATVFLAPRVKRWLTAGDGAAAIGSKGARPE